MTWIGSIGFIGSQLLSETFALYGRSLAFLYVISVYIKGQPKERKDYEMDFYRKGTENGLSETEVNKRLEKHGYNEIEDKEKVPLWKLFLETFKDAMVVVLLAAAGVQILLGEIAESLIIFLVLLINAVISVVQTK